MTWSSNLWTLWLPSGAWLSWATRFLLSGFMDHSVSVWTRRLDGEVHVGNMWKCSSKGLPPRLQPASQPAAGTVTGISARFTGVSHYRATQRDAPSAGVRGCTSVCTTPRRRHEEIFRTLKVTVQASNHMNTTRVAFIFFPVVAK